MATEAEKIEHTPGPWTIEDPMGADIGLSVVQCGLEAYEWEFIAMVSRSDWVDGAHMGRQHFISPEEQIANARLIAAAPDLLDALRGLVNAVGRKPSIVHEAVRKAEVIISKAEGRS